MQIELTSRRPTAATVPYEGFPHPRVTEVRRRVAITGIGLVSGAGIGTEAFWDLLMAGRSAVRAIDHFDTTDYPIKIAAPVPGFDPSDFMSPLKARALGRFCQLVSAASRLAVCDARIPDGLLVSRRSGFFMGTAAGPVEIWERQAAAFSDGGYHNIRPTFPLAASPHSAVGNSASELGIMGPIATYCSDCPSGLDAVAAAANQIAGGTIDIALAGGADAPISPLLFGSFVRSKTLAPGGGDIAAACRPFDRQRAGFVLGEGSAILVLEDVDRAIARGARIYGEIAGAGSGRDRPTYVGDTDPSGQGFAAAIESALSDAGMSCFDIDLVSAHAPGISTTDLAEVRALQSVFGSRRSAVPVTSIKGALGHPLASAGVMQIITGLLAAQHSRIPATVNCEEPDAECRLDVVRETPRYARTNATLVTSHGFAGNTTAVVVQSES